jgi:hypothetical protein
MNAIRKWVISQMIKSSPSGVVKTLPKQGLIELNTQITINRLITNGIDPNALKTPGQVENALNQLDAMMAANTARKKEQSGIMKSAKIMDMKGQEIPKGSKIMGGQEVVDVEGTVKNITSMEPVEAMKEANKVIRREDKYKNLSQEDAKKILQDTEDWIFQRDPSDKYDYKNKRPFRDDPNYDPDDPDLDKYDDPEDKFAKGGIARLGFKAGGIDKARRAFLKVLGAGAATVGAVKSGLLKLGGKQAVKEVVKTAPAPGKPEWFDTLVNKVISQGEDVTKDMATLDRQIIHRYKLDTDETVDVTQYLDSGDIKVSYDSPNNMAGEYVDLNYKAPEMLEDGKVVPADFKAIETEPRGVRSGPDDYDIEFDGENIVENVDELMSDTTKLKSLGGKNPSMREILEGTKKKKRVQAINEDQVEQAEYLDTKYGPAPDDYASGGIARMLGE